HTNHRVVLKRRAGRARASENVARPASPAAISNARFPPELAQSVDRLAPPATVRFSLHGRDRYLPPKNPGVAPDARAKTSPRFSLRAHSLRPGLRDECVVLHAHRAEFLPGMFRFSWNRHVAVKLVALNHAMPPPVSP